MLRTLTGLALATALAASSAAGPVESTLGLPRSLRVLVPGDETPEMFSFEAKGKPGFERELIEGFCRIHGLSLDVVRVKEFEQIIPMLQRGEGDIITGLVDTEEEDARLLAALNGYLSGMRQARHSLMFKYLSEEALTLFAQARRE